MDAWVSMLQTCCACCVMQAEAAIQGIWRDVLGLAALPSVSADFFSLGGTSLQAGMPGALP